MARPQGVIVIARVEGNGAWQNVPSYLPLMKEISFRHFGNCFGEEPWRGGRRRGLAAYARCIRAAGSHAAVPTRVRNRLR